MKSPKLLNIDSTSSEMKLKMYFAEGKGGKGGNSSKALPLANSATAQITLSKEHHANSSSVSLIHLFCFGGRG